MRSCVAVAVMGGVLWLGASSGRASELVFIDESAFVAALGGALLTVHGSGSADGDSVADLLRIAGTHSARGILWNDLDFRGDTASLSSLIHVPAADLDDGALK